ncbi:FecR domain-containing protein [Micromonospora sp. STR1s_5]|nr:FecR domain-containing protein [Micromonospora sp. STR1s_5]
MVAALSLSDHGPRYAQATPPAPPATIGRVEIISGQATVIRNGTAVVLNRGDIVFKGDVVQTDRSSTLGITFIDGSSFNLGSGARMVLNDMVYQPNSGGNSALLNIVQGSVTFLAGQVAKTGEMRVGTPVATMGIRGTLVNTEINAENGQTRFAVLREPNGQVGRYDLIRDGRVIATVSSTDQVTVVAPSGIVSSEPKTFQEQQAEQLLVQQVFQIFSLGQANPLLPGTAPTGPATPGPGGGAGGAGGGGSTDPNLNGAGSGSPGGGTGAPAGTQSPEAPRVDNTPRPCEHTGSRSTHLVLGWLSHRLSRRRRRPDPRYLGKARRAQSKRVLHTRRSGRRADHHHRPVRRPGGEG